MTRSASASPLASEFDTFLFAPIGEDRNEMPLSVLSALARLDVDPWQEAANLARLPGETATQRLASLIAALPDGPSADLEPRTIAARLIALLPGRTGSNVPLRQAWLGVGDMTNSPASINVIFFNVIVLIVVLGVNFMVAMLQPSAQVDNAHAPASSLASEQIPPPSSGRAGATEDTIIHETMQTSVREHGGN